MQRIAPLLVVLTSPGLLVAASSRSANFIVYARDANFARQIAREAERLRDHLAMEWLGGKLRPWRDKCPIRVQVHPRMAAGGETSFAFRGRGPSEPTSWQMKIWGSRQRVFDSVLPHEVTHTIFATHFGQPLPRWADEGACTTVEAASERKKHELNLLQFLRTNQGIPFARMFAMKQYPRNILPLYAQGYSVARYLIDRGGKRRFVRFVGEGLRTDRWAAAVRNHYSYKNLSDLQLQWNRWVARGCPPVRSKSLAKSGKPKPTTTRVASTNFYLQASERK